MKLVLLTFLVFLMTEAYARDCEVYGISDSPQKLTCTFKDQKIALRCNKGQYYLNTTKIQMAYHLDVESGSSPLVFKAPNMVMTVVIEPKIDIQAELEKNGKIQFGTCI